MIKLNEFKEKCKKGFCLRKTIKSKQCEKESKQNLCYDKYIKKLNDVKMKSLEKDYEWENLKESIKIRDNNECRFYQVATNKEKEIIDSIILGNKRLNLIDGAHVVARGICKEMIYHEDNVYLLNRWVHSCLDSGLDPLTGKNISYEETQNYWKRIIGEDKYNELWERCNNLNNKG